MSLHAMESSRSGLPATAIANGIPGPNAGQFLLLAKGQDLGPRQQQAGLQVIKIIQHIP